MEHFTRSSGKCSQNFSKEKIKSQFVLFVHFVQSINASPAKVLSSDYVGSAHSLTLILRAQSVERVKFAISL